MIKNPLYLEPGTVGACVATPGIKLGNALMSPKTDRGHYFLVWKYIPSDDDYIILESIGKGLAVSRMSKYKGKGVQFFEVNCLPEDRNLAPIELTRWGESCYDKLLILKLVFSGIGVIIKNLFKERKLRKIRAEELPYSIDKALICTEAVQIAYLAVGFAIVDPEVVPTPSAFKQAELNGTLIPIHFKW